MISILPIGGWDATKAVARLRGGRCLVGTAMAGRLVASEK